MISLTLVAIAGSVHLPQPISGDAALYQLGAIAMSQGDVLYRDFWDLKKPGIYLFHLAAGELFGHDEFGLHLFELIYLLGLSALLLVALRDVFRTKVLRWMAPLATVGAYYVVSSDFHLTQPAILVSLPVFLTGWMAMKSGEGLLRRWLWSAGAGMAGACALLFKDSLVPLVLTLLVAGPFLAGDRTPLRRIGLSLGILAASLGFVLLWMGLHGAGEEFLWTVFQYPSQAMALHQVRPLYRLRDSLTWFAQHFWPFGLAVLLVPLGWQGLRREREFTMCALWLGVGFVCIVLEPFAWWQFDMLLLTVPLGLLALRGIDGLIEFLAGHQEWSFPNRLAFVAAAVSLLVLPAVGDWSEKAGTLTTWSSSTGGALGLQLRVSPRYREIWTSTRFLDAADALPGPIYVFGDPLVLRIAGRESAGRVNGWGWEIFLPEQWVEIEREFRAAPPSYIFIDHEYQALVVERAPSLLPWLAETYVVQSEDSLGTWHRRATSEDPGCPAGPAAPPDGLDSPAGRALDSSSLCVPRGNNSVVE